MTSKYRSAIEQMVASDNFITDGGIETSLMYDYGMDLPCFASFLLLKDSAGIGVLRRYYEMYFHLARRLQVVI